MMSFPNVIDGRAIDAGERAPDVNPSNLSDVIGELVVATAADVDAATAGFMGLIRCSAYSLPERMISTRRFLARPSAVVFDASGLESP